MSGHPDTGIHHLQPWWPSMYGVIGPRNTGYFQTPYSANYPFYGVHRGPGGISRGYLAGPLTVPYYVYHFDPLFQHCAFSPNIKPGACAKIYGSYIYKFDEDPLLNHGFEIEELNAYGY